MCNVAHEWGKESVGSQGLNDCYHVCVGDEYQRKGKKNVELHFGAKLSAQISLHWVLNLPEEKKMAAKIFCPNISHCVSSKQIQFHFILCSV